MRIISEKNAMVLFSLKGLSNIGQHVNSWFEEWKKKLE